ncbi:hypothetical protein OKW24_005719 [Peribacillus simplex]|uniref:hypothetical protein n=1 Tax=Peribacillus simplex TaxID=1478 RepID=UPI0024E24862|nr:hypothetical protein [Peribacillus simplex]MDF9763823.1 hypothetical protein [Peribacillus simplex]
MRNKLFLEFERVLNFNVKGESVSNYWCVKIWDDFTNHSFYYESFEEIIEDWKSDQVIESLKKFEILEDFIEGLDYQKGFYYPSESNISSWIEIQTSNRQNESFRLSS